MTTWTHEPKEPLPLTAPSGIDRAAHHRLDEAWLAAAWSHPTTRVFVVSGGQALIDETEDGTTELVMTPTFEAPLTRSHRYFLGCDEDGVSYFALQKDSLPGRFDQSARALRPARKPACCSPRATPGSSSTRSPWRTGSACTASAHAAASAPSSPPPDTSAAAPPAAPSTTRAPTRPSSCSSPTTRTGRCSAGEVHWPEGRFSTLAGFVEPGEAIEESVRREVFEEAGVTVGEVTYVASQPWPFPSSLMLGFTAKATSPHITVDGEEIEEARWFSREELRTAFETGEVRPPYGISIAARLIELWYGEPLPKPGVGR